MEQDILQQGVNLMLFGMGSVFVFLTLLVIGTTIMSAFVQRYLPEAPQPQPSGTPNAAPTGVADPKLLAIIKAAVDQHRAKNK